MTDFAELIGKPNPIIDTKLFVSEDRQKMIAFRAEMGDIPGAIQEAIREAIEVAVRHTGKHIEALKEEIKALDKAGDIQNKALVSASELLSEIKSTNWQKTCQTVVKNIENARLGASDEFMKARRLIERQNK